MTTAADPLAHVVASLEEALARFGSYSYEDKGPAEVMDTAGVATYLRSVGVTETTRVLLGLGTHPHGEALVDHLVMVFVEDETWPELTDHLRRDPAGRDLVPWLV